MRLYIINHVGMCCSFSYKSVYAVFQEGILIELMEVNEKNHNQSREKCQEALDEIFSELQSLQRTQPAIKIMFHSIICSVPKTNIPSSILIRKERNIYPLQPKTEGIRSKIRFWPAKVSNDAGLFGKRF